MDIIIYFFRDFLSGPVYVVVTIICLILICSCIGYLAERSINKKKEKEKYAEVANPLDNNINQNFQQSVPPVQTIQPAQPVSQPVNTVNAGVGEVAQQQTQVPISTDKV